MITGSVKKLIKDKRKVITHFIKDNPMLNQLLHQKFDRETYVIEGPREGAVAQSIRLHSQALVKQQSEP